MKSILVILGVLFFGYSAFAGCEDGSSMAEDAAMSYLTKNIDRSAKLNCKVSSDPNTIVPTDTGEIHTVVATCRYQRTLTFTVFLREIEDAMCVVEGVNPVN